MRIALFMLMLLFAGVGNADDELIETSPCPGLVSSYDVEMFERLLVVTDAEFASIEDCKQLGEFYSDSTRILEYSLNYSRLSAIVDQTWQPMNEEAPFLLLDAILSWMKRLGFEEHAESFRDFINEYMPAQESIQLFFTFVIWFVVFGALVIVLYEFYRAGMLRIPRLRSSIDDVKLPENKPVMQWDMILALPLREQISALLQHSIDYLVAGNMVPSSNSYTNRELLSCLEKSDSRKAGLLREQIDLTEPVLYGNERVSEEQVVACRHKNRRLRDA